ncbi:hypothetical protein HII13_002762 [Brettanomyces bruxellensis]|nr:hypothetical protein HII13_002762 [Brettanomyces bruxellensis]
MNALGPRGTAVTKHVNPGTANEKIEDVKLEGLGCIMTNTQFSEQEAQEESKQETNQPPAEILAACCNANIGSKQMVEAYEPF